MIALCTTFKDEDGLLAPNLRFHQAAGVDTCYVFDDGSADGSAASVAGMRGVELAASVAPEAFLGHQQLERVARRAELVTARQVMNLQTAMARAGESGHEWMVSLDADELAFVDDPRGVEGSLRRLLAGMPPEVDVVRFRVAEAVPSRTEQQPCEGRWLFRTKSDGRRDVLDPYTDRVMKLGAILGHTAGKCAVRIRGDIIPRGVHFFASTHGRELRERQARWLLHWYVHSFAGFLRKFRRLSEESSQYLYGGAIEQPKRLWIQMANDPRFSDASLRSYFDRWIAMDVQARKPSAIARLLALEPKVVEFEALTRFWGELEVASEVR